MASVAALYDIHGNLAALEAVLAEVPEDATIVVGGDVCAGGEQPSETLARLRRLGDRVRWVRGNADRELFPGEEGLAPPEVIEEARSELSEEEIAFLHELPETQQIEDVLGRGISAVHHDHHVGRLAEGNAGGDERLRGVRVHKAI